MITSAIKLDISVGQFSDKGRKPKNEDFHGLRLPSSGQSKTKGIAAAVADGVSSSEVGQMASGACVVGFLEDYYSTPETWSVQKSAQQILTALNSWLYSQGQRHHHARQGMLTTFSALVMKSTTAHLFHIGDSRIYKLQGAEIEQLTADHQTWISKDKAFLSRAMGADIRLEIDYRRIPLSEQDIFVLTTDGVHNYVSDKIIMQIAHKYAANLETAAREIVQAALANNSPDNATCLLIRIDSLPSQEADEVYRELTELPFPPPLEPGMLLDGYRILREIHASERSQLYLAKDTTAGTQVALKTPSSNYEDDPAYIERFIQEEWIGRRIDNPHVVKIFPPSQHRKFLYHVTEYLEGVTLRQWLHDHPKPNLDEVRRIIEQVAKGLRAFHRLEMLHQDLKPDNVMIDRYGHIKLVDFGSTRVAGISEITTPIERILLLGTKNYCAPEYSKNQPGTNVSDIYSLGVIAYEMLTGQFPYGDMPHAWKEKKFIKLNYIPVTDHNSSIPRWVDGAIRKAVHPDPQQRYAAISEFIYDLSHPNTKFLQADPRPLLERNPVSFWRAMAIILALLHLLWFYLYTHT